MHPSLTDTFYQRFIPKSGFYTILKLWLQRIQKYNPQGHPWSARKSSPNTFSSAQSGWRESLRFCFYYDNTEFSDGTE